MGSIVRIIAYLIVSTVVAGALAVAAIYVQGVPIQAAQAAAKTLLGTDALICNNAAPVKRKTAPLFNGKIVVLNRRTNGIDSTFHDALPTTLRASQASEVGLILCVEPVKTYFDTDYYGASNKYSCTRYTQDLKVYALDPVAKTVTASDTIEGGTPPECPDKTDTDLTKYGDFPTVADILKWLNYNGGPEKPA
jgi:hypothetical protein